ncbi:MAG TPA: porin [Novosphingobium sp.]
MATNQWLIAEDYRRRTTLLGLLLAGAASAPAYGQAVAGPVTELSFTAQVRHDSNIASDSTPGLDNSDDRLNIGAAIRLARPFGRHSVSVDGFLGYDFYRRNKNLNAERISFGADGQFDVGFCQVGLTPRFNRNQSNLYDLSVINVPGIASVRNIQTTQSYRGELRCGNSLGIRPLAYYQRTWGNNSNALRKFDNYRGETIGGGLSYSNPVLGNFDVSVERTTMKYPNRQLFVGLSSYRLDQVVLSVSRDIGAVLTANGSIAFSHVKPESNLTPSYTGMSWSLGLTMVPTTDLQLHANLSQQIDPSLNNNALYSRTRNWGLSGTYQMGPRTSAGLAFSRNERSYRGALPIAGPQLSSDNVNRISGRFDFTPNRRMGIGLEVGHERRNANGTFYDYRNTFVAVNTRFTLGA